MGKFLKNKKAGVSTGAIIAVIVVLGVLASLGMYFAFKAGGADDGNGVSTTTPPPSSGDVRNGIIFTFYDPDTGAKTTETYTIYVVDEANPDKGTGDMGDCHSDIDAAATALQHKLTGTISSGQVSLTAANVGEQTWKDNDFFVLVYANGDTDFHDNYYGPFNFQWVGSDYDFTNGPKYPIDINLDPVPTLSFTYWGSTLLNADWSADAVKPSTSTTDFSTEPDVNATPWYAAECEQLLVTGGTLDQIKPKLAGYSAFWIWYGDDNVTYENNFNSFRYSANLSGKTVSTFRWDDEDREYLKVGSLNGIQSWFKTGIPYVITFQSTTLYPDNTATTSVPWYFYIGETVTDEYVQLGSGTISHTSSDQ